MKPVARTLILTSALMLWVAIATSEGEYLTVTRELAAELPERRPPAPAKEIDEAALAAALARAGGNRTQAARLLGLKNRYALLRLMKRYDLSTEDEEAEG